MIRRGQAPGQPNHQWCVGRYLHGNQPRKPPFCPIRHTDAAARYHLEISAAEADPTYHPGPADQAGPRAHRARGDGPPHGRRDASNASDRRTSGQNWRPRLPPVSRPNRIAIGPLLAARRPRDGSRWLCRRPSRLLRRCETAAARIPRCSRSNGATLEQWRAVTFAGMDDHMPRQPQPVVIRQLRGGGDLDLRPQFVGDDLLFGQVFGFVGRAERLHDARRAGFSTCCFTIAIPLAAAWRPSCAGCAWERWRSRCSGGGSAWVL